MHITYFPSSLYGQQNIYTLLLVSSFLSHLIQTFESFHNFFGIFSVFLNLQLVFCRLSLFDNSKANSLPFSNFIMVTDSCSRFISIVSLLPLRFFIINLSLPLTEP